MEFRIVSDIIRLRKGVSYDSSYFIKRNPEIHK